VLIEGRHERKSRGLHDVGRRCPDRDAAVARLDLERRPTWVTPVGPRRGWVCAGRTWSRLRCSP